MTRRDDHQTHTLEVARQDWILVIVTVALVLSVSAGASRADQVGAAVDLGRVEVDEPLHVGQRYVLPTLRVRNPGTVTTDYRMVAQPLADAAPAIDGSWVEFSPTRFTLEAGEVQPVEVILEIVHGGTPGDYDALLAAQAVAAGDGAQVAAAAASRLTFTVQAHPTPPGSATWLPWLLLSIPGLLLLYVTTRYLRSRYRIQLVRR
jgi:hypothetical protein